MKQNNLFEQKDEHTIVHNGREYRLYTGPVVAGKRSVIYPNQDEYPQQLRLIPKPPKQLYVIGDIGALAEGLAIIGARKATPYGSACAEHFAELAALKGISIISGGAYGCDAQAHRGALKVGGKTVVFLGGGCDQIYPPSHYRLFQDIVDNGGALVSENPWGYPALPFTFRQRNRLIAGAAKAVLIVEAGLPSGTFSTADESLAANKEVLVIPGAITSKTSAGSNKLLYQGATPIIDDESFESALFMLFGTLCQGTHDSGTEAKPPNDPLLEALLAQPMRIDELCAQVQVPRKHASNAKQWITLHLVELESAGHIARYRDGRYGPARL